MPSRCRRANWRVNRRCVGITRRDRSVARCLIASVCLFACAARQAQTRAEWRIGDEKEWRSRTQETIRPAWQKAVVEAALQNDPSACIYSTKDRGTLVSWRTDREGVISNVRVEKSSGVEYLDRVAVDTLIHLQRIPPPPPQLIDKETTMSFTLTTGKSPEDCSVL